MTTVTVGSAVTRTSAHRPARPVAAPRLVREHGRDATWLVLSEYSIAAVSDACAILTAHGERGVTYVRRATCDRASPPSRLARRLGRQGHGCRRDEAGARRH